MRIAARLRSVRACRRLRRDESGATIVEFTVVMMVLFVVVLGIVDFGYALYQWNSASKAVQLGARIAAVSDPVDSSLIEKDEEAIAAAGSGTLLLGAPLNPEPYFAERVCTGGGSIDACGTGSCSSGPDSYDAAAMCVIVNGHRATDPQGIPGMRHIYPRIRPENVTVRYAHTGLGFVGRPGIAGCPGMVPTVTVEVTGLDFEFFFLGGLLRLGNIQMPRMHTTVTGEDLCSTWE